MKITTNRRDFLKTSAILAAGATLPIDFNFLKSKYQIGLQLWSVRDAMDKDAMGTLKAIAKQGYNYVEGFGLSNGKWFGMTAKEFKKALNDVGLSMPTSHIMVTSKSYDKATKMLNDEFKKNVDSAIEAGQKYFVVPYMADEDRNYETVMLLTEAFNKAGEYCKAKGLRFGYHNHDFEFKKFNDGQIMYDVMIQNTDPKLVTFEMDMNWVGAASYNPIDWIKRYPGRYELAHVKDIKKWGQAGSAIVGTGEMDFKSILSPANQKTAGLKYLIVELEDYVKTSVEDVGECIKNLRKILG
jgi:sugar phosphate isomerase/epimerase